MDSPVAWRIVPTNLCVRADGTAVMGAGIALQAARRNPQLPDELGAALRHFVGSRRTPITHFPPYHLTCLPTRNDWHEPSDLGLIERGLGQLVVDLPTLRRAAPGPIALPLLGCGLGQLCASRVVSVLRRLLDDRFVLVLRHPRSATHSGGGL